MFANGSYAKVWGVKDSENGKSKSVRISTSKKTADNTYEQDFSSICRFVGKANKEIQEGDRIRIVSCGVENRYDKEKDITSWYPVVFDFELA